VDILCISDLQLKTIIKCESALGNNALSLVRNSYIMNNTDNPFYRKMILTKDGSHSLYVPGLDESYHSTNGAIQEAAHIFIKDALNWRAINKRALNILEIGFGTGLNALLSLQYAQANKLQVSYFGVEKYPITEKESLLINYANHDASLKKEFMHLHQVEWGKWNQINKYFSLFKQQVDFRSMELESNYFDVVYFDAFGPDVQPDLWTDKVFELIYNSMRRGGVMTTYSVKGIVRRAMKSVGFEVEKIPGPIGKREITRAVKI
jgi:tRNA U34 5-methylaminomethyl-2-thiouridine-forming methyltransferase MnmC